MNNYRRKIGGGGTLNNGIICIILTVIVIAAAGVFLLANQLEKEKTTRQEQFDNASFYQKLANGFDVNILIVGDSIAAGSGSSDWSCAFSSKLVSYLKETYFDNTEEACINVTNVSMGGNASYAGYARVMELDNGMQYDLAIICYGQNDGEQDFSLNYETLVRAICGKYPKCSIISVLESSQRDYTGKMQTIQEICDYYAIPVADTIAPFQADYDELVTDGVHPNDAGHAKYAEILADVINRQIREGTGLPNYDIEPINRGVSVFKNCRYIDKLEFSRTENIYTIETAVSGVFGIDYRYQSGDNRLEIYVDGEMLIAPTVTFNYDFSQRHILIVSESCTVEKIIELKFSTKEQADGFEGLIFSWE